MCKFTIAIPVYNGIKNIAKVVESGINQDYDFEFEILVVDNNSNDGTA
jgi:glycosyltransferase involved in cell wall biosynthesis